MTPYQRRGAAALIVFDVGVAIGAPLWDDYFTRTDTALQLGAAALAIATFLGVWFLQRPADAADHMNAMRDAIAASFVVTYLAIVGWSAFLITIAGRPMSAIAQDVIPNFTVLTGIVVGGYFGADALKQVTLINRRPGKGGDDNGTGEPQ